MSGLPSPNYTQATLSAPITQATQAATKAYVDTSVSAINNSIVNVLNYGAKGDGSTNDTAAIQAVLNTFAGKAMVFIPATGHSYMVGNLTVPSGTDLLVNGTVTSLPNAGTMLFIQNVANITVQGHGTLDGNNANQSVTQAVFYVFNSSNVRLSGLTLQNAKDWNLNVVQSSDVVVDGVTMLGGIHANQFASGCDSCWLTNCTIDGPTSDIGFSFYGGVTNSGAIGNVVRNSGVAGATVGDGINVLCDASQPASCSNILIDSNIVHHSYGGGITVDQGAGGTGLHTNITISNNKCHDNGTLGFTIADIGIKHCVGAVIVGNQSTTLAGSPAYAFYVGGTATSTLVTGNQASHVGGGTTSGVGLYVDFANILHASGNQFIDNQGSPSMISAIAGTAGLRCAFVGNFFDRPNNLTPISDTVMSNALNGGSLAILGATLLTAIPGSTTYANDAAAAAGGVAVGQLYRNGSVVQCRIS